MLTTETHLAWSETGPLYRVDAAGIVMTSEDGGESWKQTGNAGGGPSTVTVDAKGRLYVALAGRGHQALRRRRPELRGARPHLTA